MRSSHKLHRLIGNIAIALFFGGSLARGAILPAGFSETQYGADVGTSPTAMEFAPDGRLFVCLQGGQLRVISNGTLLPAPFVTVSTNANGERGLLGVAFDPNFATNQFVYVYYTVITSPIHNRVSRFTASGNVAAGGETVILDLDNLSGATNHNGGAIHFGPDGKLYVAVGENANAANAQTLANRLGKLLRINADGTIPSDNPTTFSGITGSPSGDNRAIWAVGLRNPFTFGFQPGTGRLFINDVGEITWEEINDGIAGSNYGWNICEGFCSPSNANYRDPLFEYGHGSSNTTGCAIVGGAFYNPAINQFPASFVGKYFFGDLCRGWIRLFDPSNGTASGFATNIVTLVDLKVGPDGSLYYLAQGEVAGQIWKISATSTGTPTPSPAPVVISGTVSYCSDPIPEAVPGVTLTLTGTSGGVQSTDGSGNYSFTGLTSGGSYTVTPSKTPLMPGIDGIDGADVVAVIRHFLEFQPLIPPGCQLDAADADTQAVGVSGADIVAIQRFYLGLPNSPTSRAGQYRFTPANRLYSPLVSNQTAQNYDALIYGDVTNSFVHRLEGGSFQDATGGGKVAATVAAVTLPEVAAQPDGDFAAAVTTTAIDGKNKLVGFQSDITFDERVVTFDESQPVQAAGLTAGNWNVSGHVLQGAGPIRTLRLLGYSNDFTPLSGSGTLFELRMRTISDSALRLPFGFRPSATSSGPSGSGPEPVERPSSEFSLAWAAAPYGFLFIDASSKMQPPGNVSPRPPQR